MPICTCGFNSAKARLNARELESYAVIHDDDGSEVMILREVS